VSEVARFPFADARPGPPGSSLMPLLPLTLSQGGRQKEAMGLLDTGGTDEDRTWFGRLLPSPRHHVTGRYWRYWWRRNCP
jgi:hypothetical protein